MSKKFLSLVGLLILLVVTLSACVVVVTPAAAPESSTAPEPEAKEIVFGLDWAFVGQHVPFFVALDKGFWAVAARAAKGPSAPTANMPATERSMKSLLEFLLIR